MMPRKRRADAYNQQVLKADAPASPEDLYALSRQEQWTIFRQQQLKRIAADYWERRQYVERYLDSLDRITPSGAEQRTELARDRGQFERRLRDIETAYAWDYSIWSQELPPAGWRLGGPAPDPDQPQARLSEPIEHVYEEGDQHPSEPRLIGPGEVVTVLERNMAGAASEAPKFIEPPRPLTAPERHFTPAEAQQLARVATARPGVFADSQPRFAGGARELESVGALKTTEEQRTSMLDAAGAHER